MTSHTNTRDSFIEHFGEKQARAIERAAESHKNGIHDDPGSDPFRWAITICIGYECMEVDEYRESHGITALWDELKQWIIEHGDIANHDGDCDYLGAVCGVYDPFIKEADND